MMRNLFGKMFSFLGKREETENQSEAEPSQSALESLMSMATAEANVNNSATVGDDATITEPTSSNALDWENVKMDFASKPSTSGVHFSDESQSLMESQGKITGKQIKEAQQNNLESADIGIPPNEFLQQNRNIWEEIGRDLVIQQDINSSGKTSHHDKSSSFEILEHGFVHQSEKTSQEAISAHDFLQLTVGGQSSFNEGVKVNQDESNNDFEIQPHDFCMSIANKIETLDDTQGNQEACSEIGAHAFIQPNILQQDCMENAEIPPPIWAVLGQETTVASTTAFPKDANHKDEKCTKLSYASPVLQKESNSFEKEDLEVGSKTMKQSTKPDSATKSPELVDKLVIEKDITKDDSVNVKRDGKNSDIQTGAKHGRGKDKDSRKMTKDKSNQGQKRKDPENWRSREPKDIETARTTITEKESEDWRSRETQTYIEEPKDIGEYLSFVNKMTEIGRNVKAKDLIYKLGYLKNVEQSKIEQAILRQYEVAVAKKSTGWIKDARYFCEILFPQDWIDENLVPLDGRKDGRWRKKPKKPQQKGLSEGEFTHLSSGEMCRDVRLKSDPTLTIIRADMGSGDREGQKSEQVPSGMLTKPSTCSTPIGKQGGLQDLERLENLVSGIASNLNEKATVRMEEMFEDKENALEVGVSSCMGKVFSRKKETCSEEDPVHEMKLNQGEDGSILTPRKRGEELAIGFNYHSDVLAKESSPLKVEATDQDLPSGHGESLESGHRDDSLCNTPGSRKAGNDQLAIGFSYHSEILAKDSSFSVVEEEAEVYDLAKVLASVVLQSPFKGEHAIASFIQCEEVPEGCVSEDQIPTPSESSSDSPAGSLW